MSLTVGPGIWAKLHYRVFDAEGELVADETLERLYGYGQLLPVVEQALDGRRVGERAEARVAPRDAFGARDASAVVEVERGEFPADVAPGDHFQAEDAEGRFVLLTVLDVDEERVVIDQNHPLAGQSLRLELEVLSLRVAEDDEITRAEKALQDAPSPDNSLIPAQALLAGPKRRYEDGSGPDGAPSGSRGRRAEDGE